MLYRDAILSEVPQVVVHQSSIIVRICFRKVTETTPFVKAHGISVGIDSKDAATETWLAGKSELDVVKNQLANTLTGVSFINGQTTNFHGRIMRALLSMRYLSVYAVTCFLAVGRKLDLVTEQTIIGHNITVIGIYDQIGGSEQLFLIVNGLINQEVVQIVIVTFERLQNVCGFQLAESKMSVCHHHQLVSGLDITCSYAERARSISSFGAGCGVDIYSKNCSASLPERIGVSLIGLAIIQTLLLVYAAKVQRNNETTK